MNSTSERRRRGAARTATLLGVAATLLALVLIFSSCSNGSGGPAGRRGGAAVPVLVAEAVKKDVPVVIRAIGSVRAIESAAIRAQVGGVLLDVAFREGDDVEQGDLLFRIDPSPFEAVLRGAEAALARDSARAVSAESESRRYANLVEKEYITTQQYDDARANADALHATVEADRAALRGARLDLAHATIRAPITGRTGDLLVTKGNLIKANGDNPIVVIKQIAPITVEFSVPERRLAEIRRRAAEGTLGVEARIPTDTSRVVDGTLTFVDNAVDEATGTILLKATFPNEDHLLWPGQFVNVSLALSTIPGAIVVPVEAVSTGQEGRYVYTVGADSSVSMVPVETGPRLDGDIVIAKGVDEGATVVTDGQLRLVPGAKAVVKSGLVPAVSEAP